MRRGLEEGMGGEGGGWDEKGFGRGNERRGGREGRGFEKREWEGRDEREHWKVRGKWQRNERGSGIGEGAEGRRR